LKRAYFKGLGRVGHIHHLEESMANIAAAALTTAPRLSKVSIATGHGYGCIATGGRGYAANCFGKSRILHVQHPQSRVGHYVS
jgi:hypothetical protein